MKKKSWTNYYRNHKFSFSNILLHYPYLLKILLNKPKHILEIGCGTADHSLFIKKILPRVNVSLLDLDKNLLNKVKKLYKKKITAVYNIDVLDKKEISTLPKFDLIISQGLLEHFNDNEFIDIINNFSETSKKMIFSIPSNFYQFRDFGNEILRSKEQVESLLIKCGFKFKVSNYIPDIGIKTKIGLIRFNKMNIYNSLKFLLYNSCHLLVEINYKKELNI